MVAYEKSLQWQELFDLAVNEKVQEEELKNMAERVSGKETIANLWYCFLHDM